MIAVLLSAAMVAHLFTRAATCARVEKLELVAGRRSEHVVADGAPWKRAEGCIESAPGSIGLWADRELGTSDFAFEARIAIEPGAGAPALVRVGDCVVGFEGDAARPFVDGAWVRDRKQALASAARLVTAGRSFDLSIRRARGALRLEIERTLVFEAPLGARSLGRAGFEPGGARVRVHAWSIDGELTEALAPAREDALAAPVDAAIGRAVDWLLARQMRDGSWRHMSYPPGGGFDGGQTALCVYTLLRAGLRADHPSLVRALASLERIDPEETYTAGLFCLAYEATRDPARLPKLKMLAAKLATWQQRGGWGYPRAHENDFGRWLEDKGEPDLSNTQYAVLGLRAARHAGVDVPDKVWTDALEWTLDRREDARSAGATQTGDRRSSEAGFRYADGRDPSLSMTAAGVAIVAMCREALGEKLKPRTAQECDRAVRDASAWIGSRFTLDDHPGGSKVWQFYSIEGIERAGTLLETRQFGDHDWYVEGAKWLLAKQEKAGNWSTDAALGVSSWHTEQAEPDTCFAILFLQRASRATVRTGEPLSRARLREAQDEGAAVKLRVAGNTRIALWIAGFSDEVRRAQRSASVDGIRVVDVEYLDGDRVIARVEGDPSRAFDGEEFGGGSELREPGEHVLRARVRVVDAKAALEAHEPTVVLESKPVVVRSQGVLEPWMLLAPTRRTRNAIETSNVRAQATSVNGAETAERAFDGNESTRWVSATTDRSPTVTLELQKPVKADRIVLGQGAAARDLTGKYDRIDELAVRVNRDKEWLPVVCDPDEVVPAVLALPKTTLVARLEIRVARTSPGGVWKGHVSLSEVSLEREPTR